MRNNLLLAFIFGMCCLSIVCSFIPIHAVPPTTEKVIPIPPAVGSLWEIKTGDPFPATGARIKVLETKAGWVRYYVCPTMPDERCTVEVFLTIHRAAINNEAKVTP